MADSTQRNRQIAVATPLGEDKLLLVSFSGQEEMSRLFQYRLEMLSSEDSIAANRIVGKNVTFMVKRADGSPRFFNGFVNRFAGGTRESGFRNYYAEVVPWLWFLTRTTDCRIFQNKSIPEIIEQIFGDIGFSDFETGEIKGSHKKWDYCVQYRESDFNFVSRLMEEEGIFYYFRHENGKHTLVLADQKGAYKDLPEREVEYEYSYGGNTEESKLTSWQHQYEFVSGKWAQTDYNFKDHPARGEPTPSKLLMTNEKTAVQLDNIDKFEIYDFPGSYEDNGRGKGLTRLRMEEEETGYDVVHAEGTCKTFNAGGKFCVKRHDIKSEQGKSFVITSIHHWATEPSSYFTGGQAGPCDYRNTFTCIPDSVSYRPRRTTPKPVVYGVQTAVVTGPAGEEIYPDQYGRVKVQFFWDREGKRDENTSCWVRVSQSYAGKKWGSVSIPRIGQEVLVDFIEGDPDRPIITGRVYNADQMPPYPLPGQMMLTGMKSDSTKGGGGYNEYVMDDTKGKELIREHGQYDKDSTIEHDLREHVLHDRSRDVTNNETIKVGNNRNEKVGVNESLTVGANRTETIGANSSQTVGANKTVQVAANSSQTVGASQTNTVALTKNEMVGIASNEMVGVIKGSEIGAAYALTVGGGMNTAVGFLQYEEVGMKKKIIVGNKFEMVCGASKIIMESSGKVTIEGTEMTIKGTKIDLSATGEVNVTGSIIVLN